MLTFLIVIGMTFELNLTNYNVYGHEEKRFFLESLRYSRSSIHTTPDFGYQGLADRQFYPATIEHL
jgi:hypothetical protein